MQVAHHHSPPIQWQMGSASPRERQQIAATMSSRIDQPLIFSIDDRLEEQHLTRLDLSSKNLTKIERLPNNVHFNVILLDQNEISKIEHLDSCSQLVELSISHNRLNDIHLLSRCRSLQKLNLSYNSIDSIDCLRNFQNLVMLNISHNHLHSLAVLNTCHALQSLDASENSIHQIEELSQLTSLKYLNLHKNLINTLISIPRCWPKSLHTLVLSDNEIQDLTEVSYLSSFINLSSLYLVHNPCLSIVDERLGCYQPFDYRPYILNWCLSIHNLDGVFITRKESLKAEWLLSQGKGRSFSVGDHEELVQYLTRVCGTDAGERDDLHLSRIMLQQDLYNQQQYSDNGLVHSYSNEQLMATSDTMKDANETLSKNIQGRLSQNASTPEPEFRRVTTSSSGSTIDEPVTSVYHQQARTPSPGYIRPTSVGDTYIDDQITENSSSNRYTNYDNRPIKPLDKNILQTQLNQYPINNVSNKNTDNSRLQQLKRASSNLTYNANRYSPKTTTRGPTTSSALSTKSTRNFARQRHNRIKRPTTNSNNTNALRIFNHSHDKFPQRLTTAVKVKNREQHLSTTTSDDYKNQHTDDDELQLKFAPLDNMCSTRSTTINKSIDLQRLTTSVETMRTSILQAYIDLHEKFTKTTELQTSALTALWKQCETQSLTHRRETEKIIQENRLLNQRIRDLEARLNTNKPKSIIQSPPKQNPNLYPPLRAHISKRDTKSFYLHWIPNPLNERHSILGYRIYIDDILKGSIDSGRFEAIIDYIRDEGEYKIKLRTYDQHGESADSNIVVARFRRHSTTATPNLITDQNQNENIIVSSREQIDTEQRNMRLTPPIKSDEQISPRRTTTDNIISRKPPRSPTSSPNQTDKTSPNNASCSKVLFTNDSSSSIPTKRSPTRTGIMSRLTKSPHRNKQNNILLNALPIDITNSPTEPIIASQTQPKITEQMTTFQSDLISSNHEHILTQQVSVQSSDVLNSNSVSPPPPPPVPPRISRNMNNKIPLEPQS